MTARAIGGFRRVQLGWGESLQNLAARELGDASLWVKIAEINRLAPPYVTGDPGQRSSRVAMYGDTLAIPDATADIRPGMTSAEDVFQRDILLRGGAMSDDGAGDILLVAGRENLMQSIKHRINTNDGELIYHLEYGCKVGRLRGKRKDAANMILARMYVEQAVLMDDRISRLTDGSVMAEGDAMRVEITAETATGHPVDVSETVGV